MVGRLAGKVALVSGAARGMGAAEATLFAREGAAVVVADIDGIGAAAVAAQISDEGGQALPLTIDVSEQGQWELAVDLAIRHFGHLDVLLNNAGICPGTSLDGIDAVEWDRVQAVNLRGVFLGIRAVLPHMKARRQGAIVNIASIAATGARAASHYSASKAGVVSLTKVTAAQQGRFGIRANVLLPGPIVTAMLDELSDEGRAELVRTIPLGRLGEPRDVAAAALFLASDEAAFISGAEIVVDGAFTLAGGMAEVSACEEA